MQTEQQTGLPRDHAAEAGVAILALLPKSSSQAAAGGGAAA